MFQTAANNLSLAVASADVAHTPINCSMAGPAASGLRILIASGTS
ncbi:hypothetical protein WGT02_38160 (plasmid) [Rhizobium sp. T1470]